jgi:hypothetical protein
MNGSTRPPPVHESGTTGAKQPAHYGPTPVIHALFDKSFLQSISDDESVWFDHFYSPIVCPIFYIETLADLAHKGLRDRSPEREVQIIAGKFPKRNGSPCADHRSMVVGDLLGHEVPMDGRIPLPGGRTVRSAGETGVVFEESPETVAFNRWQKGEFQEIERTYADGLRNALAELDLTRVADSIRSLGATTLPARTLQEAKELADIVVTGYTKRAERLYLAIQFFDIPVETGHQILHRWEASGRPALHEFAPYAAYVLTIEIFFHVALGAQLIGSKNPSNRTDIAYLFYLPFSHIFVSSDRLHSRCAPLFLRPDQRFAWGFDLKADLKRLNGHYSLLPEDERQKGIITFARKPPIVDDYLTSQLYDLYDPGWRDEEPIPHFSPEGERLFVDKMEAFWKSTDILPDNPRLCIDEMKTLSVEHKVHKRKGSWWQLPKDLPDDPRDR